MYVVNGRLFVTAVERMSCVVCLEVKVVSWYKVVVTLPSVSSVLVISMYHSEYSLTSLSYFLYFTVLYFAFYNNRFK